MKFRGQATIERMKADPTAKVVARPRKKKPVPNWSE